MDNIRETGYETGSVLDRYRYRLRAVPRLTPEQTAALPVDSPALWEQALVIAYEALAYACSTGAISKAALYDEDTVQAVNTGLRATLARWNPAKGNLVTFLSPRVIGAAKRYRSTARRGGITGLAPNVAYATFDSDTQDSTGDDTCMFPDLEDTCLPGGLEQIAYAVAPDGYESTPIEAAREKLREAVGELGDRDKMAVTLFYGLMGKALTLRQVGMFIREPHPEQVKRIITEALHKLKIIVTRLPR